MRFTLFACLFMVISTALAQAFVHDRRSPARLRNGRRSTGCLTSTSLLKKRMVKQPKAMRRRGDDPTRGSDQGERFGGSDPQHQPQPQAQPSGEIESHFVSQAESPSATEVAYDSAGTTSTTAAATETASSSSSTGDATYSGQATYFLQNDVAGACGTVHSDNDQIVALSSAMYGDTGLQSQDCGQTVVITNKGNSKSVTATVADVCPSCATATSIDLSVGAFTAIGNEATGVLDVEWQLLY